uniref:Uncharacterized protein n=1 Tax=Steinernema glaseri TaxID=37863 RepID=A0A1I7ZVW5_9BILA
MNRGVFRRQRPLSARLSISAVSKRGLPKCHPPSSAARDQWSSLVAVGDATTKDVNKDAGRTTPVRTAPKARRFTAV